MKALTKLFVIALALMFVAASCEKEGIYKPKEKISKIYYSEKMEITFDDPAYSDYNESETLDKFVKEIWNWDGKLLKSINYYDEDGDLDYAEVFNYKGKRLTEIISDEDYKYVFEYDGKYVSTVNVYYDGEQEVKYDFTHDGNKISEIKCTYVDYKKSVPMTSSIFRFLIPSMDSKNVNKLTADVNNSLKKADDATVIKFEWDGDNVKKVIAEGEDAAIEYTYDNYSNPFKSLFNFAGYEEGQTTFSSMCSKNNVVKEIYTEDGDMETTNYTYTYDGKFPATKTLTMSYHENYEGIGMSETYSIIWYYEYK